MKTNDSLDVLRLVVEQGFGNADMSVIDKVINDNWIEHQFGMKGGKEGLKKAIQSLDSAFSNRKYELMNYSVNDDIVWVHYKASGEHTGPFMGHEPTGKKFSIDPEARVGCPSSDASPAQAFSMGYVVSFIGR